MATVLGTGAQLWAENFNSYAAGDVTTVATAAWSAPYTTGNLIARISSGKAITGPSTSGYGDAFTLKEDFGQGEYFWTMTVLPTDTNQWILAFLTTLEQGGTGIYTRLAVAYDQVDAGADRLRITKRVASATSTTLLDVSPVSFTAGTRFCLKVDGTTVSLHYMLPGGSWTQAGSDLTVTDVPSTSGVRKIAFLTNSNNQIDDMEWRSLAPAGSGAWGSCLV